MILCMDTAHRYMGIALIENDEVVDQVIRDCFKKQAENLLPEADALMKRNGYKPEDIERIVISEGPGSYTGVRIAMTITKVIGETLPCEVYTISTLRLYAGGRSNCMVVMDARADRVYCGVYDGDDVVMEDRAIPIAEVDAKDYRIIGDASLLGKENDYGNIAEDFLNTRACWKKADPIHLLTPKYLKESESYYR